MTEAAKNRHAQMLGRRGGQAKTDKKVKAARRNLKKYWAKVKCGDAPRPRVGWPKGRPRKINKTNGVAKVKADAAT